MQPINLTLIIDVSNSLEIGVRRLFFGISEIHGSHHFLCVFQDFFNIKTTIVNPQLWYEDAKVYSITSYNIPKTLLMGERGGGE